MSIIQLSKIQIKLRSTYFVSFGTSSSFPLFDLSEDDAEITLCTLLPRLDDLSSDDSRLDRPLRPLESETSESASSSSSTTLAAMKRYH